MGTLDLIRETADAIEPYLFLNQLDTRLYLLSAVLGNTEHAMVLDVDLSEKARAEMREAMPQAGDMEVNLAVVRKRWRGVL